MSVLLKILQCILCCEEEQHYDRYDVISDDTSVRRSSAPSYYDLPRQSPNLSASDLTSSSKPSFSSSTPTTSSNLSPLFSKPPSSSSTTSLVSTKASPSSSNVYQKSSPTPPSSSSTTSLSSTKASPSSSNVYQKSSSTPLVSSSKPISSFPKPATSSYICKPPPLSPQPPSSSSTPSSSSSRPNPLPSLKKTLSTAFSNLDDNYVWLEKSTSRIYKIPKDIEDLIKKDIVPRVLKMPLSPSTYKDYFAALLYAEDFYIEKWNDFKLENVTLALQKGTVYKKSDNNRYIKGRDESDDKIFVVFEIENIPEERPFLLSRDFIFARPSGLNVEPFQGILYRVERSTRVLVEFGEDFHYQHCAASKYDVSFSFNRVCLKRAHQAIAAASDSIFRNFIFPNNLSRKNIPTSPHSLSFYHALDQDQKSAVLQILSFQGPPAYLVLGPLCVKQTPSYSKDVSRTGLVVQEAVLQIYRSTPKSRILICAPLNKTCDVLMKTLKQDIRESDMFRANAAFRELDGVPIDILPYCPYKRECFVCPPLQELQKFRVILSTFVSSFRLHDKGITAGHFTHIVLVDTSSVTEPEAMVALSNLADEKTVVVVTGAPRNRSGWVRSDIARRHGLRISYFERLLESNPYRSLDPSFITQLGDY